MSDTKEIVGPYSINMSEIVNINRFLEIINKDDSFKHTFKDFPAQPVRAWWSLYRTWVDVSDDYYKRVNIKETDHKQVDLEINGIVCQIDEEILQLVLYFNGIGVPTLFSCQGSEKSSAYISFDYIDGFFDKMVGIINIFNRAVGSSVNIIEEKSIGDRYFCTTPTSSEVKIRTSIYFKNIETMKAFEIFIRENNKNLTFSVS